MKKILCFLEWLAGHPSTNCISQEMERVENNVCNVEHILNKVSKYGNAFKLTL